MPEAVNKILNPATKQSAVCWWETHALLHRETRFWSSECILSTEIRWQNNALWLFPDGPQSFVLQVERGSMCIWVPNHHSYSNHKLSVFHHSTISIAPKHFQILRSYQSHEPLGGIDTVQTQGKHSPEVQWDATCLVQQMGQFRGSKKIRLNTKWLYNLLLNLTFKKTWNKPSSEKQNPFHMFHVVSVTFSVWHLATVPYNCLKVKHVLPAVPGKCCTDIWILSDVHFDDNMLQVCLWVLGSPGKSRSGSGK